MLNRHFEFALATAFAFACVQGTAATLTVSVVPSGAGNVVSTPGTINCGAPGNTCSNTFTTTTSVTLTATPAVNYVFDKWTLSTGGTPSSSTATLTQPMPPIDIGINANFAALPAAPSLGTIVRGNTQLSVPFVPGSIGDGTFQRYEATCATTFNATGAIFNRSLSPVPVTGLTNATMYWCMARTVSSWGAGPWSASQSAVPAGLPGAPSIETASIATGAIAVAFKAPLNNGGAVVDEYRATCTSSDGGATTVVYGGLPPLKARTRSAYTYTCTVAARNLSGWSPESAASNALLTPFAGNWQLGPGADGGSPVALQTATLLPDGRVLVAGGDGGDIRAPAFWLFDPAQNIWDTSGAGMQTGWGRCLHTSTLMADGTVLIVGGNDCQPVSPPGRSTLASVLRYDPVSDTTTALASLTAPRQNHVALRLNDGRVLVVGGDGGDLSITQTRLYDPATDSWSAAGSPGIGGIPTATLLADGRVLVAGGTQGGVSATSAYLFNPNSNSWSPVSAMPTARSGHTATLLPNGVVLVAGGTNNGTILNSAQFYDPASDGWSDAGTLQARSAHAATLLPDGKVLVLGGYDSISALASADVYDPATNTWSAVGSMWHPRYAHTATLLADGRVMTGFGYGAGGGFAEPNTEFFDSALLSWTLAGNMAVARATHTLTQLTDGQLLAAGGTGNGSDALASAALFNLSTGLWSSVATMIAQRAEHTATLSPGGQVLLAGGRRTSGFNASAELFDPATGISSATTAMASARYRHTATLLPNGEVLVAGGNDGTNSMQSAAIFNFQTKLWRDVAPMGTTRERHTATLLSNGKGVGNYKSTVLG